MIQIGYSRAEVLEMSWHEVEDFTNAYLDEENQKLVMLMNCMAIAYGGTAKDRKKMAEAILGLDETFNPAEFESIMATQFLATPADEVEKANITEWAASEFNADDPAFQVK